MIVAATNISLLKPLIIGAVLFPLAALASMETVRLGAMNAASVSLLAMGFADLSHHFPCWQIFLMTAAP